MFPRTVVALLVITLSVFRTAAQDGEVLEVENDDRPTTKPVRTPVPIPPPVPPPTTATPLATVPSNTNTTATDEVDHGIGFHERHDLYVLDVQKIGKQRDCPPGKRGYFSRTIPRFGLCTHGFKDVVSGYFIKDGYWRDCTHLPHIALMAAASRGGKERPFVVEVGGNIGTCGLLMASQGCDVMSFEPMKSNFQCFNASIKINRMEERVKVVNAGAADRNVVASVRSEKFNFGNTILQYDNAKKEGSERKTEGSTSGTSTRGNKTKTLKPMPLNATFLEPEEIQLVTMDSMVKQHVDFMKLDCQGSELVALKGATHLLEEFGVAVIQVEFDTVLLGAVGTKPIELLEFLWERGYTLFDLNTTHTALSNKTLFTISREDVPLPLDPTAAEAFVDRVKKEGAVDILALSAQVMKRGGVERFLMKPTIHRTKEPLQSLWVGGAPVLPFTILRGITMMPYV